MTAVVTRRRLTVEEFERMGEAGILHPDERVELIEGELVQMAPIGSRHAACVTRTAEWFGSRVAGRASVRVQNPIRLSDFSEPEPDIVLVRPRADFYASAHPEPADIFLIVEVSDTTIGYDREVKLLMYAVAGIPEVWIANLDGDRIEAHRDPHDGVYRTAITVEHGDFLTPLAFPDLTIAVEDILGGEFA